jgi:hypothetical protein
MVVRRQANPRTNSGSRASFSFRAFAVIIFQGCAKRERTTRTSSVFRSMWPTSICLRDPLATQIQSHPEFGWRPLNQSSRVSLISRNPTATKLVRSCLSWSAEASQKCTSGRANIVCNNIGVPHPKGTRRVGASARSPVNRR